MGLREQILGAPSKEAINKLLVMGEGFTHASNSIRRRWQQAADRRRKQLETKKESNDN
jgi:hypothetical protein